MSAVNETVICDWGVLALDCWEVLDEGTAEPCMSGRTAEGTVANPCSFAMPKDCDCKADCWAAVSCWVETVTEPPCVLTDAVVVVRGAGVVGVVRDSNNLSIADLLLSTKEREASDPPFNSLMPSSDF